MQTYSLSLQHLFVPGKMYKSIFSFCHIFIVKKDKEAYGKWKAY